MSEHADIVIRNATIYDGLGGPPTTGCLTVTEDRIGAVGAPATVRGEIEIDATGMAVAPGFINMLSWANEALLHDGCSQSDIRQGVTLEVLGEGHSMGPWTDELKRVNREQQGDVQYEIDWTTLDEYLRRLERQGVSPNIASFVGATTVREHVIGYANRPPTPDELTQMQQLVRQAMRDGAVGVSSALAYSPAAYATTDELTTLARAAAEFDGLYASHIRNEADALLEAFDEFLAITRAASVRAEVYHIKASGRANWPKLATLLARIEDARAAGLAISADMYPYDASSSGLDATMPPWVHEGGTAAWLARLREPEVRRRVIAEMKQSSTDWDNFYASAGSPANVVLVGFKQPALKPLAGQTIADVAAQRNATPEDAIVDLVLENGGNVGAAFFCMSEENLRAALRTPWISFCSDAQSIAAEGLFLDRSPHPRTYGAFARVLGRYVRDEALLSLSAAIHRMTALPATNLKLTDRGRLAPGHFADIVVFDPAVIADRATFARPHRYAVGVHHVLVNGELVLRDGEHTGATPGRVVRGPVWLGRGG